MTDPKQIYEAVSEEASTVLLGNEEVVELLTISLLTKGHVLLEGVPGVAKTTIAKLFAETMGLSVNRIQMTPDILPADITGTHIYREESGTFDVQRGPIFANLVIADEINRTTPKTQSALLEAMQEGSVTIEGETLALPTPFMVIATQNPIEMEGTFELPKAQRDRFQFKLRVPIPGRDTERELLRRFDSQPDLGPELADTVVSAADVLSAREATSRVYVDEVVIEYVLDVVDATRQSDQFDYGASPRASIAFLRAGKARAAIHGREYVIPDDVKALALPVLGHRVVLSTESELSGASVEQLIDDILDSVEPPSPDEAAILDASSDDRSLDVDERQLGVEEDRIVDDS